MRAYWFHSPWHLFFEFAPLPSLPKKSEVLEWLTSANTLGKPTVTFDMFSFTLSLLHTSLVFQVLQASVCSIPVSFSHWTNIYWVLLCARHSLEPSKITVNTNFYHPCLPLKCWCSPRFCHLPYFSSSPWTISLLVWFHSLPQPLYWWFTKTLLLPTIPLQLNIPKTLPVQCILNQIQLPLCSSSIS